MAKISVILLICATLVASVHSIGVNYGTNGNNLPPPAQVAQFLKEKTNIDRVKIYDARADILRGFANTGISVTVTVPNGEINAMVNLDYARRWVEANIKPFYPQTKISYICVGNEILFFDPQRENLLLPALQTLYAALVQSKLGDIKVTTPHALVILEPSPVPSAGKFKPVWEQSVIVPMLKFLRETKSPFMVNPYPYFGYSPEKDSFALFKSNQPVVHDTVTNQGYSNMYDMQLDTVYVAMKNLGFDDVEIVVGEVGWPSQGENQWCNVENAAIFNGALVRKYNNGEGTPLMPKKKFETYIFALFNENLKGNIAEKNFGLFMPDFTPVYNIGIMKESPLQPGPKPVLPQNGGSAPVAQQQGKKWCVPKPEATDAQLQKNLDWVCSQAGIDCKPIQAGGACFDPNNVRSHASYAMNAYYQAKGMNDFNCDFSKSGLVSISDQSYGSCIYHGGSAPVVQQQGKKWCLPKPETTDAHLQANIDWVCGQPGIDCRPIQAGGACFDPNNVRSHAAYAMNTFYQAKGKIDCGFDKSGFISISDPSYGSCVYPA